MIYLYSIIEGFFFTDFFSHSHKLKGLITNHKISCDEIDDKALLAMLYVFSKFVSDNEKELVSAKIM